MNRHKRTCVMEADLFTVFVFVFFLMFKNIESICCYTSIHGDSQKEIMAEAMSMVKFFT